jgi:hypothetical protein
MRSVGKDRAFNWRFEQMMSYYCLAQRNTLIVNPAEFIGYLLPKYSTYSQSARKQISIPSIDCSLTSTDTGSLILLMHVDVALARARARGDTLACRAISNTSIDGPPAQGVLREHKMAIGAEKSSRGGPRSSCPGWGPRFARQKSPAGLLQASRNLMMCTVYPTRGVMLAFSRCHAKLVPSCELRGPFHCLQWARKSERARSGFDRALVPRKMRAP